MSAEPISASVAGSGTPDGAPSEENVAEFDSTKVVPVKGIVFPVVVEFTAKFGNSEENAHVPSSKVTPAKFRMSEVIKIPLRFVGD